MAGLTVGADFDADAALYANGTIDLNEFGRRIRARNRHG
ncbi:antitoxin VbhA family protein [Cryobacterium sp. SO1]|nr:antitoxin VbhA family protein [Cryobacterium sp. SO1]